LGLKKKKKKPTYSTASHREDAPKASTRKGTAALLTNTAKDQGEDIQIKTQMNLLPKLRQNLVGVLIRDNTVS